VCICEKKQMDNMSRIFEASPLLWSQLEAYVWIMILKLKAGDGFTNRLEKNQELYICI